MNADQNGSPKDVAQRFGCDPDVLQQVMERVRAGEISPAAATGLLLSSEVATSSPAASLQASSPQSSLPPSPSARSVLAGETLATLIGRFGAPPEDIVAAWCQQLRIVAVKYFAHAGQPLPPIDLHDWMINPSGQLQCRLFELPDVADQLDTSDIDGVSADRIRQFHKSLVAVRSTHAAPMVAADIGNEPDQEESRQSTSGSASRTRKSSPARIVVAGLILVGIVTIVGILIDASQDDDQTSQATVAPASRPANVGFNQDASAADLGRIDDRGVKVTKQLETFDSPPLDEPSGDTVSLDSVLGNPADRLSVDALQPQADLIAANLSSQGNLPPQTQDLASSVDESSGPKMDSKPLDILSEDEGPVPEESPQVTRTSPVRSVQLPPPSDVDTAVALTRGPIGPLQLEFPCDVALKLRQSDQGSEVVDAGKAVAVGRIQSHDHGATFTWSSQAGKVSTASSLVHGRLKVAAGEVVYLRPTVQADPWPIDLQRHDVRPTWDLHAPLPPRVARLSIEFQLPAEVEQGWIEQLDATSPHRTRGLAVLSLRDDESVSLGMRFDIRGGRKLSCRVRYAARLGPEAVWQVVSRPLLEQFADAIGHTVRNQQRTAAANVGGVLRRRQHRAPRPASATRCDRATSEIVTGTLPARFPAADADRPSRSRNTQAASLGQLA